MRISALLALQIASGDEITFPIPTGSEIGWEIYITKAFASSGRQHDIYQALIEYVTQPKLDKRGQHFVSARVREPGVGISAIFLPCGVLRDYFYVQGASADAAHQNYYEKLCIPWSASPAELRVAYRLRTLELDTDCPRRERLTLERAFNILAQPELSACYDALLIDPESPSNLSL